MTSNYVTLDCEMYPNYFLVAFKGVVSGKVITIDITGEGEALSDTDRARLHHILSTRHTFGFNSNKFDMPLLAYALRGKTAKEIYALGNHIIKSNDPGWKTCKEIGLSIPDSYKHFDLYEVAPGVRVSLKLYGGRMHSKRLQDLPTPPGSILTAEDIAITRDYCINDLDTTIDLYMDVEDRVKLRFDMSDQYGIDMTSKGDAQIAEAVIRSKLQTKGGRRIYAPKIKQSSTYGYDTPGFIEFETPVLQDALKIAQEAEFGLDAKGSIQLPKELKNLKINIGSSTYKLGVGGLHSSEKAQSLVASDDAMVIDRDVAAYYPSIILGQGLFPSHLGPKFLDVYANIVSERLHAKRNGLTVINEALKVVINGSFGKLGNKYSVLYSPDLMMQVTLTGQLALLMLIEQLELHSIAVMSANTDGFVSLVKPEEYDLYDSLCFDWELSTGFILEETKYQALYSRDINNYLAVTTDGNKKGKGIFVTDSLSKNPQMQICVKAAVAYLTEGKDIRQTITECLDVRQFLSVRTVNGGAVWREQYLGRVVRWIYSTDGATINYKTNGNKVAKSTDSRPVMELGEFPEDLDLERYITEANDIVSGVGIKIEE